MNERLAERVARLMAGGIVVFFVALLAGGYGAYRVSAFTQATFRPSDAPPPGQVPDPATAVAAPGAPPSPTILGYSDSSPIARLRAGHPLTILLLGYGGEGHDGRT